MCCVQEALPSKLSGQTNSTYLASRYLVSHVPSELHESAHMALYMASQTVRCIAVGCFAAASMLVHAEMPPNPQTSLSKTMGQAGQLAAFQQAFAKADLLLN